VRRGGNLAAILKPFGNLATIHFAAGPEAILAEINVVAVDGDDGSTSQLLNSTRRACSREQKVGKVRPSRFPKTIDDRFSRTL
jgi:hypothetical protein